MNGYKQVIAWQKAIKLIGSVFTLTDKLPRSEMYGIGQQMRRAVTSVSSNIAEGYYKSTPDYLRFCTIAYGSAAELESQLCAIREMRYIPSSDVEQVERQVTEVLKLLNALTASLKRKIRVTGIAHPPSPQAPKP